MTELNNSQGYRVNCPLALLIVQVYVFCIIIMYMILILYIIYYSYNIYNIHTSYCAVLHKLPMYPTYYVLNTYVRFMFYVGMPPDNAPQAIQISIYGFNSAVESFRMYRLWIIIQHNSFSSYQVHYTRKVTSSFRWTFFLTPIRSQNCMCSDRVGLGKHISGLTCVRPYILSWNEFSPGVGSKN